MASRLVVVGASAGGVEALARLAGDLPADFGAAVVVVLHVSSRGPSALPQIISRSGPLPARHAQDGDVLEPRTIYVAPPDRHVLVRDGALRVVRGPRENGHRPAIDPLFRSAAASRGREVVAVVLTGSLDDGAAGSASVSRRGGVVVVQDPAEASFAGMPRSAIEDNSPHAVLPLAEIGPYLTRLVGEGAGGNGHTADMGSDEIETAYAALDDEAIERDTPPGDLSPFACPDCGGVLTQVDDETTIRFRCRVGHAYTVDALLEQQDESAEAALWTALRALEERADLARRLARRLRRNDLAERAERAERSAEHDERHARIVRDLLRKPE